MATADDETNSAGFLLENAEQIGLNSLWDPHLSKDWDKEKATEQCLLRIKRYIFVTKV